MTISQFRLNERALDLWSSEDTPEEVALNKLKAILKKNRKAVRAKNEFGMSLIHLAVIHRSTAFCNELLKYDDNNQALKAFHRYWGLPFHLACGMGKVETAKYLLQRYPDCINVSPDGKYVMHILARRHEGGLLGRCQLIDFLGEHYPHEMSRICTTKGNTPLHDACRSNNFEIVRRVFNAYPDAIYIWNNDRDTPLGVAAAYQLDYVLTFFDTQLRFVREGQDDSARDSNGRLLIH
jgi:ankyrin repeat protein